MHASDNGLSNFFSFTQFFNWTIKINSNFASYLPFLKFQNVMLIISWENRHTLVAWKYYHWVAIVYWYKPNLQDESDVEWQWQWWDTSSIPPINTVLFFARNYWHKLKIRVSTLFQSRKFSVTYTVRLALTDNDQNVRVWIVNNELMTENIWLINFIKLYLMYYGLCMIIIVWEASNKIFYCKIHFINDVNTDVYLCAGNSIHFRPMNGCSCGSVKVCETENVLTWELLEPPSFGFMPNALTYWAIRARHLLSHVFVYVYIHRGWYLHEYSILMCICVKMLA